MDVERSGPFSPGRLGSRTLKNRIIKAATYEGMTRDGLPGERLRGFHRRLAEGGVAMTTLAYCATEADGRLADDMMYLHEGIEAPLRTLVSEVHTAGALVSAQMVHCGNFSRNRSLQRTRRALGPSRQLNRLGAAHGMPFAGAMTLEDIDHVVETFAIAARLLQRVGFDAVELHFGHGYALSQFISPRTNRRRDDYGGSFDNRMRLPLRVLEAVRAVVGDGFPILGKISMTDGVKGGVSWDEGLRVATTLDAAGIDALVTSAGTSSFNPMLMFHGESIVHGMIEHQTNPIAKLGLRLIAPRMFRDYPYEELYLLEAAKRVRDRVDCAVVYIGGCSTRESLERAIAEGFDFVQLGRPLIKDPDFPRRAMDDPRYDSGCTHCNRCVAMIDDPMGIRCPLDDPTGDAAISGAPRP